MLAAANEAAAQINVQDLEENIAASLQAKLQTNNARYAAADYDSDNNAIQTEPINAPQVSIPKAAKTKSIIDAVIAKNKKS